MDIKKTGSIAIVGKPNVGKSTLLNTIANKKVAIVSYKPQTTRNQIKHYFEDEKLNIVFIDTPGFHFARNKLDLFLNSEIKKTFKVVDLVLFLIDPTRPIDEEDLEIIKFIKSYKLEKVILVITKSDVVTQGSITNHINGIKDKLDLVDTVVVSSKKQELNALYDSIFKHLPVDGLLDEVNQEDNFNISEIIREQVLLNCKKEVPYSAGVQVEKANFDQKTNVFNIYANILVEKASQKPIIIGHGGSMIKKIGTNSRLELLKIYDCKINLKLFVKVQKD
ncbi:MAG: GTPase Era [Mycoplasmoidaceae bacterium]|nr:GTPase Era [Mycoplasmoidaceae bacterium]